MRCKGCKKELGFLSELGGWCERCHSAAIREHENQMILESASPPPSSPTWKLSCKISSSPTWRERAERKEFREGDVVWVEHRSIGSGAATVESRQDGYQTIKGVLDGRSVMTALNNVHLALLRPVDWEPEGFDKHVVCIKTHEDAVNAWTVGTVQTIGLRFWWDNSAKVQNWAPAELADPLIEVLKGGGDNGSRISVAAAGSRETLNGETVEWVSVDEADGVTGHQIDESARRSIKMTTDDFKQISKRIDDFAHRYWRKQNESGPGITADNLTNRQRRLLDRWTATYYTPAHCPRCGADGGCMCPRVG